MKAALENALSSFDAGKLRAAVDEYEKKLGETTAAEANLTHAEIERARQEIRLRDWRDAVSKCEEVDREIATRDAAVELTELARKTLRDAAPAVAQHLCNRIAARAQGIFNRINPEPVQLHWNAERYSMTIVPDDRRFAMLSEESRPSSPWQ